MANDSIFSGPEGGSAEVLSSGTAGAEAVRGGVSASPEGAASPGNAPGNAQANTMPGDMRQLAVFTGSGWSLLKIHLVNYLLILLTLGVYSFWAKVRVRRYLWENTAILGEPLEYTGTGGELFRSFLIVMALGFAGMAIVYACSVFLPFASPFALYVLLVPLGHFATYQALRYRLTRVLWNGIRGNMDGSATRYALAGTGYTLLTLASLFLLLPLETARLTGRRLNAAVFGNRRFRFSGVSGPLFALWLPACLFPLLLLGGFVFWASWSGFFAYSVETGPGHFEIIRPDQAVEAARGVLFIVGIGLLIGILRVIYTAAVVRWSFANLAFGGMRFDARSYTAWRLFRLKAVNAFLLLITLGIAYPWTEIRLLRFFLSSIRYAGDPDLPDLLQDTLPERSGGEGLLDALDVDLAI